MLKTGHMLRAAPGIVLIGCLAQSILRGAQQQAPPASNPPSAEAPDRRTVHGLLEKPVAIDNWLRWPLPASEQAYAAIDGVRLLTYVKDLTAISRRSRDRREQYWGRIIGTQSDVESSEWLADKFRKAGLEDVRAQPLDLPPLWFPTSWSVNVTGAGKSVSLESAWPARNMPATPPAGLDLNLDLEAAYVGMGTEADFAGRDVRGRAVFIYSMPMPGPWQHSANVDDAIRRAEQRGAAATFTIIALPGNIRSAAPLRAEGKLPTFSIGLQDGTAVRRLIETASPQQPPRVKLTLATKMVAGLKTTNVWGVLPGATDEKIIISAHRDGFFEGASDNASGVATMIGVAEHFAKIPKAQRRRTLMFVGIPGHHGVTDVGVNWITANLDKSLAKTVFVMNGEHTAAGQFYLWGPVIRRANMGLAFFWRVAGSPALEQILRRSFQTFGVPTFAEPEPGGLGQEWGAVPTLSLVTADMFYHTDAETEDTIPPFELEASTRAFAKIIDEVNRRDAVDLAVAPRKSSGAN
jgi:hypothetical protein